MQRVKIQQQWVYVSITPITPGIIQSKKKLKNETSLKTNLHRN